MGHPDPYQDPYQRATKYNTSTDRLEGGKLLDLDLDGMGDFAQNMTTLQGNLNNNLRYVTQLLTVPMDAWHGPVLGEADFVRTRMRENATELTQYIQKLSSALQNIGMAAQTIADTYGAADGFSAIELNTVRYAFAEPGANRPGGLSPLVTGETYEQKLAAATGTGDKPSQTGGQPPQTGPAKTPKAGETPVAPKKNPDGTETVATRNPQGKVTERGRTAPQTAGGPPLRESPRQEALDSLEGMY